MLVADAMIFMEVKHLQVEEKSADRIGINRRMYIRQQREHRLKELM